MKILGRAYKENLVLGIIMAVVSVACFIALGIILFDITLTRIILSSFFFTFALFCLVFFSTLIILQLLTAENIILFNEQERQFTVYRYRREYKISLNDLREVKYYNKGLLSFGPLIFRTEFDYGKIVFLLNNGTKIVTPNVTKVVETYNLIKDLLDKNNNDDCQ